jgi:hypothetical protein
LQFRDKMRKAGRRTDFHIHREPSCEFGRSPDLFLGGRWQPIGAMPIGQSIPGIDPFQSSSLIGSSHSRGRKPTFSEATYQSSHEAARSAAHGTSVLNASLGHNALAYDDERQRDGDVEKVMRRRRAA